MFIDTPPSRLKRSVMAMYQAIKPSLTLDEIELSNSVAEGHRRHEQRENAQIIAAPMRELFDMLMTGETYEINGEAVMRMPERVDLGTFGDESAEWVNIAPAIDGWIDCWARLDASINTYHLGALARQLRAGKQVTARLVEQARAEFEATIDHYSTLPPDAINSAITTTQIAWEFERLKERKAA